MDALKVMVRNTARYLGFEISRYATDGWVTRLQRTAPLRVVFDVGANRGVTAARFKREFPEATIYAFEPGLMAFSELEARTASDSKIKPFHLALGEHDGSATLHENADDVTSSLLPNSSRISQFAPPAMCAPKNKSIVPLMRIDTFCAKERIDRIDLLKIDSQGYERHILNGAGNLLNPATIRGLLLEVQFVESYKDQTWCGEVLELLRAHGYRLFGFTGIACDYTHGWKWADAMFIADVDG